MEELLIPKMTIQTLVENAVVHGIENATWDCFLYILGERKEDMAVFVIKDNGVGIEEEKLNNLMKPEDIEEQQKESTHTHLGIYAVKKRLDYVYQNKASLNIISEIGNGTEVRLEIPLKEKKEEYDKWNFE